MDSKLTLSIRPDIIVRLKAWAKKEGKSLSAAIEDLLDKAMHQDGQTKNSLDIIRELGAQKKSGHLLSDEEYEQKKKEYLTKKYGGQ